MDKMKVLIIIVSFDLFVLRRYLKSVMFLNGFRENLLTFVLNY